MGGIQVLRHLALCLAFFCFLSAPAFAGSDLTGTWQGADKTRHVLQITKDRAGGYHGQFYNLGPEGNAAWRNGNAISFIGLKGRAVEFSLDHDPGHFVGTVSGDGNSIAGTWQVYGIPQPLSFKRASKGELWPLDTSPHTTHFVEVEKGVALEVLDWGGKGPPLIFLAGLGSTAHVFDEFAPGFTVRHHVLAITRRGFGLSSAPPPTLDNYDSNRLGDDVLAVIDKLKLKNPVIAGHSIAGEELSSIGARHPENVAGLIYLEAGYGFAFYDPDLAYGVKEDVADIIRAVRVMTSTYPQNVQPAIRRIQAALPHLQKSLDKYYALYTGLPSQAVIRRPPVHDILDAMDLSLRKYGRIKAPILSIYAIPQKCAPACDTPASKALAAQAAQQADAFQSANPAAHVIRMPFASHLLFRSNEAEVRQAMNKFMDGLPK